MLSGLFGGRDCLTKLAKYSDLSGFVIELATSHNCVLTVPCKADVDPENMTADELATFIEPAATERVRSDTRLMPFTYTTDGIRTRPLFFTEKLA